MVATEALADWGFDRWKQVVAVLPPPLQIRFLQYHIHATYSHPILSVRRFTPPLRFYEDKEMERPTYLFAPVSRTKYCSWLGATAHGGGEDAIVGN